MMKKPSTEDLLEVQDDITSNLGLPKAKTFKFGEHWLPLPSGIKPLKPGDAVLVYCPACLQQGIRAEVETRMNPATMTSEIVECKRCQQLIPAQGIPNMSGRLLDAKLWREAHR